MKKRKKALILKNKMLKNLLRFILRGFLAIKKEYQKVYGILIENN